MPSTPRNPVPKSERVRLILEVRRAYQRFAELLQSTATIRRVCELPSFAPRAICG